jgi:tetratricopeptide (TPR) repeat protein
LEILDKVATGQLSEAEAVAFRALTSKEHAQEQRCVWITLHNMAVVRALSGRLAEAEVLEEQSLRILDKVFPLDDRVRLRPLYLLWSVQSQQQERAKARQTFRAMQSLRLESPEDQAKFHSAAAGQLHAERQLPEAEAEYRRAFAAWGKAGRADTMDVSSLLVTLATLQIDQDRFLEAGKSLDRALAIVQSAPEAVPLDLINVLRIRAILKARQGKWQAAAEDLGSAMSMSDRDVRLDPAVQKLMLDDFAYILRKAHRSKEARSIEARAKAIHATGSTNAVVDVSELDGSRKAIRK